MEPVATLKKKVTQKQKVQTEGIRVHRNTKKAIYADLGKINKKDFGRKVRVDAYIKLAISKLTPEDFEDLQNASLTQADRLEMSYRDYVKKHGQVSKDEFIGIVLEGKHLESTASTETAQSVASN